MSSVKTKRLFKLGSLGFFLAIIFLLIGAVSMAQFGRREGAWSVYYFVAFFTLLPLSMGASSTSYYLAWKSGERIRFGLLFLLPQWLVGLYVVIILLLM